MTINSSKKAGFTLVELLIGIVIIGMILGGISQLLGQSLSTYNAVQASQDLVPQARYALERMVTFVQESDYIGAPDTTVSTKELTVSERLSDQYTNASRVYAVAGDGLPDADSNSDGLINDGGGVPVELITFRLDETDATNGRLMEKMPDYGTSQTGDHKAEIIICEYVTAFSCKRLSPGIVEITLTLQKGSATVTLKTTAKSRLVE
jgi:prepilin-type N-terminal cleavage/methylation domain-containing protein